MRRSFGPLLAGVLLSLWQGAGIAEPVGLQPIPTLRDVQVHAEVTFDPGLDRFAYACVVSNPATNTGESDRIDIEISQPFRERTFSSEGLTIPFGVRTLTFDEVLAIRRHPAPMIPVGMRVPPGWRGGLGATGFAFFGSGDPLTIGTDHVIPGETQGGFELISPGPPTIRQIELVPDWVLQVETEEQATPELMDRASEIQASLPFKTKTLGPSWVSPGSYGHWDQLRDDLQQAIQLGWFPDQALAQTLVAQLASAREALDAGDGTLAKSRLDTLIQTITQSTPAQRTTEGFGLVLLSAQKLKAGTLDTPIPFEPKVTPSPPKSSLPIGAVHTLTTTVVNLGDPNRAPIPGFDLGFLVSDGPNQGLSFSGVTNDQGQLAFTYTSTQLGTDTIAIGLFGEAIAEFASAEVTWSGGPDLVVPHFVPPLLESKGGQPFFLTEWTANEGSAASPPSTTRYFLSVGPVVNPATARVLGERAVPALGPGERSQAATVTLTLPGDLPAGIYHLAACADAPGSIIELEEANNCSFSRIGTLGLVLPLRFEGTPNQPPVCSQAVPSLARLWPPNHKLAPIVIQQVVDPDKDPVAIRITGITQDEPVNGVSDGDTSPDGFGIGTPVAQVRQERSGAGNGRIYQITFTAEDGKGGTCIGTVSVGVPHDRSPASIPIDDGQRFDSTQP